MIFAPEFHIPPRTPLRGKISCKGIFAGLVLLAGLSFISCEQPHGNIPPPVNALPPDITSQPTGGAWDVSGTDTFNLTVTADSPDNGTLNYQWYLNSTNSASGGTATGINNAALILAKADYTADGTHYFYVIVTNTISDGGGGTKTATKTSDAVAVTVTGNGGPPGFLNALPPDITSQPVGGAWNVNSTDTFNLTVTAVSPDNGTLSYQWYLNSTNSASGGTATGVNNAALILAKADYTANGTHYFYVIVTNTISDNGDGGTKTATKTSDAVAVTVTGNTVIASPNEIQLFSQEDVAKIGTAGTHPLSGTYALMNDITLSDWPPIGNETKPFTGKFDGNGKTITLNSFNATAVSGNAYLGIFGCVKGASGSAKAAVKNLKIDSSVNAVSATADGQAVGLVTGYAEQADIENITLSGTFAFRSEKTVFAGGVAGYIQTGTLIKNCASSVVMDIIPGNGGSGTLSGYVFVGGIAGQFDGDAGIEHCHNAGDVTVDNTANAVGGQVFAGGIAGGSFYGFSATYKGYIQDCSFTGTVIGRAKGNWTFVGGIAAVITGGTIDSWEDTTRIARCFAEGTVSAEGTNSDYPYVGGIVGYNYYGALVSQSCFNGTVIADKSGDCAGGIAGYNSQTASPNNSRVEDCWSSGEVKGFNNAGGIVGQNQENAYIRRCYSTAEVYITNNAANNNGVGGIAGMSASMLADAVTACVALNSSLYAPAGNRIHRIFGAGIGVISNCRGWEDMPITTGGAYTARKGDTLADGADCVEKPGQNFYEGLGWDFTGVWKMGGDGYPKLKWQD